MKNKMPTTPKELGVKQQVHKDAWLNDCRFCIYYPVCSSIVKGHGKLAKKGCMITGWDIPKGHAYAKHRDSFR